MASRYWRLALAILIVSVIPGCTTVDYNRLAAGEFSGSLFVMWVSQGNSSGDGKFVFVPDPANRLTFRRSTSSQVFVPGVMYTDGGSIPRIAQIFNGLNPWGYAPAYMIHDWLFTAHHCIRDGADDRLFASVRGMKFEDSAAILGESIRALVEQRKVKENDVAAGAITAAVNSPIARSKWNVDGACERDEVTEEDLQEIEKAVPGSTAEEARRRGLVVGGRLKTLTTVQAAKVITTLTF